MWENGFDIFGGDGFVSDPGGLNADPGAVANPVLDLGGGLSSNSLDGLMYNATTGVITGADGNPIPTGQDAAIRQAFGLDPLPSYATSSAGVPMSQQDVVALRDAGLNEQEVNQIQDTRTPPSPGTLEKLATVLSDPGVLSKLMLSAGTAGITMLLTKLMASPATAPSARKIAAQMQSLQNPLFQAGQGAANAALAGGTPGAPGSSGASDLQASIQSGLLGNRMYQQYLTNAIQQQAPAEQDVRNQSIAQMARVMSGQYSNPMLDMQSQLNQEKLDNTSAMMGGNGDWLTQSTGGQRAQMFKNLSDAILKENDRRGTLASLSPIASSYGTVMNPNVGLASYQPTANPLLGLPTAANLSAQGANYLQNAQLTQYLAQNKNNATLAQGIGDVVKNAGGIVSAAL